MKSKLILTIVAAALGLAGLIPLAMALDAEEKAAVCVGCHGPSGHSAVPENPSLAGQHAGYLITALKAYMSGERDNAIMKTMAERLSTQDIEEIAAYFAAQPPAQSQAQAAGDAAAGEAKTAVCAVCHGPDGNSAVPMNPSLAGQHAAYLANALKAYKNGGRTNPIMAPLVAALSEQDIEDIAAYYAAQSPQASR